MTRGQGIYLGIAIVAFGLFTAQSLKLTQEYEDRGCRLPPFGARTVVVVLFSAAWPLTLSVAVGMDVIDYEPRPCTPDGTQELR